MNLKHQHFIGGGFLISAIFGANFLNFLFNALLGRWLSFEDFGLLTLVVTFYSICAIFTNALSSAVSLSVSKFAREHRHLRALDISPQVYQKGLLFLFIGILVWVIFIPFTRNYFQAPSDLPFFSVIPIIIFSAITYSVIGYEQGKLNFLFAGLLYLIEPLFKLIAGTFLTVTRNGSLAYLSIPLSLLASSIIAFLLLRLDTRHHIFSKKLPYTFPTRFYITNAALGLGATLFFSIDILLVKHFFTPSLAGQYALISLIGKMMFFFSILLNVFTLPLVARTTQKADYDRLFFLLVGGTLLFTSFAWLLLGFFGSTTIPFLFGTKSLAILSVLPIYTLGIGLYALSSVITSFHLARLEYVFIFPLIAAGLAVTALILARHGNFTEITTNIALTCTLLLVTLVSMHIYYERRISLS